MANWYPEETYKRRIAAFTAQVHHWGRISWVLAGVKLTAALITVILLLTRRLDLAAVILITALLLAVFPLHQNILNRISWQRRLIAINESELGALEADRPITHNRVIEVDADHRYAADLDLFCENGLFGFISRALTISGIRTLSAWLTRAADPGEIRSRQEAAAELAPLLDHRQTLIAHALPTDREFAQGVALDQWLRASTTEVRLPHPLVLLVLSMAVLGTGTALFFRPLFRIPFLLLFIVNLSLNLTYFRRVNETLKRASRTHRILKQQVGILTEMAEVSCSSPRLQRLQDRLQKDGIQAAHAIRRLAVLLEWLDLRLSPMLHFPLNNLLFWDLQGIRLLQNWRQRHQEHTAVWLEAIGEWESLASIAALHYNHPDWTWPCIAETETVFNAENLGHPLIPRRERVGSDIQIRGKGSIWIVTGPNMAGKSTFLRAVGINVVLALAGAPVCAGRCEISPLEIYTSMRISDSLDKKLSLFYAELQRLKQVIDAVGRGETVLFLIDEMLKGTNTADRQAGAMALCRQLHKQGAMGIVATHDLTLSKLADDFPGGFFNHHFDGTVEDDQVYFDYRLREGVCHNFNALVLMRRIGIHLDED